MAASPVGLLLPHIISEPEQLAQQTRHVIADLLVRRYYERVWIFCIRSKGVIYLSLEPNVKILTHTDVTVLYQ